MSAKDFPEIAREICKNPFEQFKRYKAEGRGILGYTCTYVPEEILDAFGFIPIRLLGRAQSIRRTDAFLQTYCCSQIRSMMEDFCNNEYAGIDGVIFAHTCDSMQSFHDIFRRNNPDLLVKIINFPTRVDGDIAYKYALAETRRFIKSLEEHTGTTLSKEALQESISIHNTNRSLLERLYALHLSHPGEISSATLLHATIASMLSDKREINGILATYLGTFDREREQDKTRKRIMLVGSVNINDEAYKLADEFNGMIADDDLCTGRRYFSTLVTEPTVEGIVRRYFGRPHCAAKHRDPRSRERYITGLAEGSKIDGVIFLYLKFCDPHSFDYPFLREALDKKGIPNQLIEIEQSVASSGQTRTKLQAFFEVLG